MPKKKLSGAENKKKQAKKRESLDKYKGSINKFVKKCNNCEPSTSQEHDCTITVSEVHNREDGISKSAELENEQIIQRNELILLPASYSNNETDIAPNISEQISVQNYEDIGEWPEKLKSITDILVRNGPQQLINFSYPETCQNNTYRKFNSSHYYRTLPNDEKYHRDWLLYSKNKNAVYCFSCKLFSELKIGLTTEGVNDWKNISKRLNTHETSREHIIAYRTWKDFIKRIECGTTIDSAFLKQIDENTKLWKNIIERIISTIKLIGTQNLALRGKCDKLYEDNNGNFLKIIEYLAEFDPLCENI